MNLSRGMSLGLGATGRPTGAFSPLSLTWDLFLYDQDLTKILQTAGGSPVSGSGDPVGQWTDAVNSARKGTAAAAQRGAYHANAGITFGTNEWLDLAATLSIADSADLEIFAVGSRAQAGAFFPLGEATGFDFVSVVTDGGTAEIMQLSAAGAIATSATATNTLQTGFLARWSRASGVQTVEGSGGYSHPATDGDSATGPMALTRVGAHSSFSASDSYFRLIAVKSGTLLTAAERSNFYAWVNATYNVTLP